MDLGNNSLGVRNIASELGDDGMGVHNTLMNVKADGLGVRNIVTNVGNGSKCTCNVMADMDTTVWAFKASR